MKHAFIKLVLPLVLTANVFAESFQFVETRYSDAINHSTELQGSISFTKNGLIIEYPKQSKILNYQDGVLIYKEDQLVKDLETNVVERITKYFEILILVHNGDENVLSKSFEIKSIGDKSILSPLGNLSKYIQSIELTKEEAQSKEVKLFLTNEDTITISIGNEIR